MTERKKGRRIHALPVTEDVERELRAHLDLRAEELIASGWEAAAAAAEAKRLFGDMGAIRTECRTAAEKHRKTTRRSTMWSESLQDLRYAVRALRKAPGFALVAIITLALGIGANTAAFSIVNGVLLAPLPYERPEQLVTVREVNKDGGEPALAYPNYVDWRTQSRSFDGLAAYLDWSDITVLGGREPLRANAGVVSQDFFRIFRVSPMLGRTFAAEELVPGGRHAVIVGEGFWRRQLGAKPLAGLRLQVSDRTADVIGVMPDGFDFPNDTELWLPVEALDWNMSSRTAHNFEGIARLRDGITAGAAARELSGVAQAIRAQAPDADAVGAVVRELRDAQVSGSRKPLLVLLGAAGMVLLVACTNLASGLLARAAGRQRELAIRSSLGAQRLRLIRQLLTESLLLAGIGAIIGIGVAVLVLRALVVVGPTALPRLDAVRLDGWVLGFTSLITVATALTFGIAPALRATTVTPGDVLRGGGRGSAGPRERRAWSLLVGAEVALALVLLIGAGLLMRSFWKVVRIDPGFEANGVVVVPIALPEVKYTENDLSRRVQFYDQALERVNALPGVQAAGMITSLPLVDFDPGGSFEVDGRPVDRDREAGYRVVSPDFFTALQIPLVRGRVFDPSDRAGSVPVMVINQAMADEFFQGEDPLGMRVRTRGMDYAGDVWVTIVGVVGNVRQRSLTEAPGPGYYLPYAQRPNRIASATIVVRGTGRANALLEPVRATLRSADPDVPIDVQPFTRLVGSSIAGPRLITMVLGGFAAIALVLAGVGIYGVVAFAVAQRAREIGIRMAIGAQPARVLWSVSSSVLFALLGGTMAGMLAAGLLSRITGNLLYQVDPLDPLTFAAVALTVLVVGALSAVIPAARALAVSPMVTLRAE